MDDNERIKCMHLKHTPFPQNQTPLKDSLLFSHPNPNLVAAYQQAMTAGIRRVQEDTIREEEEDFKQKCPPGGGEETIVLYTTDLRGIRKTFQDCNSIKLLLQNLKLAFIERDMSMHKEFKEELWRVLKFRAIPPRLFIKGMYIGGADEVWELHERERLLPLVEGMARNRNARSLCAGCGGMRFIVCLECDGSRKVHDTQQGMDVQCLRCNENGLVLCSLCCC